MPRKPTRSTSSSSSEDFYEVEHIVNKRTSPSGSVEYEVKWRGYPSSQNTWEPLTSLSLAQEAIAVYESQHQCLEENGQEPGAEDVTMLEELPVPAKQVRTVGGQLRRLTKRQPLKRSAPSRHFDEDFIVDDDECDDAPRFSPKRGAKGEKREDLTVTSVKESNGALVWTAVLRDGTTSLEMTVEQLKKRAPLALIDYLVSKLRFA